MTSTHYMILLSVSGLVIIYLGWLCASYRILISKLSQTIKNMYCNYKGCTNLRYYSTPDDVNRGNIFEYCSVHLVEKAEGTLGKN